MEQLTAKITFIEIALGSFVGNPDENTRQNSLIQELADFPVDEAFKKQLKGYIGLEKGDLVRKGDQLQELMKLKLMGTATVLHHYHCRLLRARHLKCFRANVYKIAEENLAFIREGLGDGIKCDSFDIELDLVFKEESRMLQFQSALLRAIGNTTSNKKPRIAMESKESIDSNDDEEDDEDEDYRKRENKVEIEIHDQQLSSVPVVTAIQRVFYHDYLHVRGSDEAPNSPQCDTFSDAGSMSIYEPETVTISIERVGQMIENPNHSFFNGKNPEIAHIKDNASSTPAEKKDENNYLFLSRVVHEAFDGINTQPSNFPWFLIRYVTHDNEAIDFGGLQRLFGDLPVYDRPRRYFRTIVHIEFFDTNQASIYSPYLRDGSCRVNPQDPLVIKMDLYFSKPEDAKKYLVWKMKKTLKKWGRKDK